MKKEIPILFSTPMVQAILAGRKTMTRRVVKPQPVIDNDSGRVFTGHKPAKRSPYDIHNWKEPFADYYCPYGKPGDLLWVRENWAARDCNTSTGEVKIEFQASPDQYTRKVLKKSVMLLHTPLGGKKKWKPCIHLPKEAARIWLEVTNVRVERLQDISEYDAKMEGMNLRYEKDEDGLVIEDSRNTEAFEELWGEINGPDSWEANPWVWVVSFRVLSTTGKP